MFYSHSIEDDKFDFFVSFLGHILKGDNQYRDLVIPIISDAHTLSTGEKNVYTIDRNSFPIIVYLVEKEKDYFQQLDINALNNSHFEHILEIVSQQREVAAP